MNFLEIARLSLEGNYGLTLPSDASVAINVDFDHLKTSRVVFSEFVFAKLQNIAFTTQVDAKEIGFLLYGKEFLPNQVYFYKISFSDAPLKSVVAEFGDAITKELEEVIDANLDARTVVAHGHSHPKLSSSYRSFSLGDLAAYIELTERVEDFKIKDMQLVGCLVTPDAPVKFAYFNPADDKFYDFCEVEVENM